MASIYYRTYDFIGNALTEEQFLELKHLFQTNRNLVEEKYRVQYLKEMWAVFKDRRIIVLTITVLVPLIAVFFLPAQTRADKWLVSICTGLIIGIFYNVISLFISFLSFLSYLSNKRRYGTLHLYLLEVCPDFKNYMGEYLKYAR